ncbi:MAG: type II secretion system protein [Thalassolituus sp.]
MPTMLLNVDCSRGFSLLQSAVALMVMSAGMLFLVPRLTDLIDEAHKAHVKSVAMAIKTGAMIYREVWMTDRNSPLLADMVLTESGWPSGRVKDTDSVLSAPTTARCAGLWKSLLDVEVPTLTFDDDQTFDFQVNVIEGQCRYYHKASDDKFFIDYNTTTGRVSWNIR